MPTPLVVAVSGSSGLIGTALVASLRRDGHEVRRLVRRPPSAPGDVQWDPRTGQLDPRALDGVDGVVNLAGAGVGSRLWTASYRRTILESRTTGTGLLARTLAATGSSPRVLVSGSATGFYGDTGGRAVDEGSPRGVGFLADVVSAWEAAALPAQEAGVRVSWARTGVVTTATGGALSRLLPFVRLGLGGRLGSGQQWWSLISLADEVRALRLLLEDERASGVYNLVTTQVRMTELVQALGQAYHRPAVLPVPARVLQLALGELSSVVLGSERVTSSRLPELGFEPRDRGVRGIIEAIQRERS